MFTVLKTFCVFSVSKLPGGIREYHLHYSPIKRHKVYFLSILQVKDLIVANLSAFSHAPLFDKAGVQKHFRRKTKETGACAWVKSL